MIKRDSYYQYEKDREYFEDKIKSVAAMPDMIKALDLLKAEITSFNKGVPLTEGQRKQLNSWWGQLNLIQHHIKTINKTRD